MTFLSVWPAITTVLGSVVGSVDVDVGDYLIGQEFLGVLADFFSSILLALLGIFSGLFPV